MSAVSAAFARSCRHIRPRVISRRAMSVQAAAQPPVVAGRLVTDDTEIQAIAAGAKTVAVLGCKTEQQVRSGAAHQSLLPSPAAASFLAAWRGMAALTAREALGQTLRLAELRAGAVRARLTLSSRARPPLLARCAGQSASVLCTRVPQPSRCQRHPCACILPRCTDYPRKAGEGPAQTWTLSPCAHTVELARHGVKHSGACEELSVHPYRMMKWL